jgi:predicted ribonuclease YlaK
MQNLSFHELDSVITRAGEGTKVIFSGDFKQSDLANSHDRQGLQDFLKILKNMRVIQPDRVRRTGCSSVRSGKRIFNQQR